MANIVCYELEDSPFFLRIDDFMFYFSSDFYKKKCVPEGTHFLRSKI